MRSLLYPLVLSLIISYTALADEMEAARAAFETADSLYQHGRGQQSDFPKALDEFLLAAKADHPAAQFYAGRMFQLGHGTKEDLHKAANWYELAGANGQARAYNNLGKIYKNRSSALYDPQAGMRAYLRASEMGMAMASYNIAITYLYAKDGFEKDLAQAIAYLRTCLRQYPNYPGAWNNLGVALRQASEGRDAFYAAAERAFLNALRQNDKWAPYNLADLYYDERRPAPPERIIELLEIGAKMDRVKCLNRLGYIHQTGALVEQDLEKAADYYERSVALGSHIAENWLAILLEQTGREAYASPRVIALFEAAVAGDNIYAKNNLGYRILDREIDGYTPADGVALLTEAAEGGLENAVRNLDYFARKLGDALPLSPAEIALLQQARKEAEQEAKAEARQVLETVKPFVADREYETALKLLTKRFNQWKGLSQNEFAFDSALWWEAQTQQGRVDPEWGWRLFEWIQNFYDSQRRNNVANRLIVRYNLAQSLIESGRMGKVHEVSNDIFELTEEIIGIDVADTLASNRATGAAFPLRYTADMATGFNTAAQAGDWLDNPFFIALTAVAEERIYAADWASADQLCEWIETWALARLADEEGLEGDNRPGWVRDTYLDARLLRAQMLEYRQDTAGAIDVYEAIIQRGWKPYKAKALLLAISRKAAINARDSSLDSATVESLHETIALRKGNQFDLEEGFQFTRLILARNQHHAGATQLARATTDEILDDAATRKRPWLRLAALLLSVDLYLADEAFQPVEAQLFEALNWTQLQGLKVKEPAIYARYVRYLIAIGDWQNALQMQQAHIALLQKLDIPLGLDSARMRLSRIYRALDLNESALAALELNTTSDQENSPEKTEREPPLTDESPLANFDLQPMRMTGAVTPDVDGRALFTLSNLSPLSSEFEISAQSTHPLQLQNEAISGDINIAISDEKGEARAASTITSKIDGLEQQFIEVRWPRSIAARQAIELRLSVASASMMLNSELSIHDDHPSVSTAIIESQVLEDNPFYLLSAFHHIYRPTSQATAAYALRAVADQPTRIEAYAGTGTLLFIDAEGNGRFDDPGDLLATPTITSSAPILDVHPGSTLIELRYQPHTPVRDKAITIQLQRAAHQTELEWVTDAIDRIVPFEEPSSTQPRHLD